ncbi:MAG: hypothetical protein IIA40_10260, partial [SAR324 cluster bacterium]|nr:hypothetical protein [SAR324 cluster bacterium]
MMEYPILPHSRRTPHAGRQPSSCRLERHRRYRRDDARRILTTLAGTTHRVITAITLLDASRGTRLTRDDCIRQLVINHLYCYAAVDPSRIEDRFHINFEEYFADELGRLKDLEADGLVDRKPGGRIELTSPLG